VVGTAGVGKSALAIHAAHRLAGRFADGQVYVNLQGAAVGSAPLGPLEVLGRFLRGLGVDPAAIPGDLEEAAALWRTQVASRRLLVVLDDAVDAAQVRPLLPAAPGCGVLVTSRRELASLEGAHQLHLDVLAPDEAIQLLGRLAGPQRVAAEPQAAAQVARRCGHLPLALRIAGARLAARPSWPVRTLADRLADAQARLDELELADIGVRASFTVSDQQLRASGDPADRAAAAAFGLLGMLDGPELGVPVAARLLDMGEQAAERVLERLVDAHLLETPTPGRYRLHDLLRLYARELAIERYREAERAAALTRALGFYAATTWGTLAVLRPGDYRLARADHRWRDGGLELADEHSALAWLEVERANLLAAIQQAATTPGIPNELATQLAHALFGFLWVRGHWDDWVRVSQLALAAAQRTGDRAAQAHAHNDLGLAHYRQGRYEQALGCHQEGLAIFRELGDRRGQAASLNNLGIVYEEQGRYQQSRACHKASLAICRELGNQRGQAISLGNLGNVHERQGRYDQALACQQESLAIFQELDDRYGQAVTLHNLGKVQMRRDRYEKALACLKTSLTIFRELGDRDGQAASLTELGVVFRRQGRPDRALAGQQQSLAIRRELGDRRGQAESLRELGETLRELGRHEAARAHWREALGILEQLGTTHADQIRALLAEEPSSRRTSISRRSTSVASPQDLDEQHPGVEHRDHQAQDDPGNQPVEPTTGPQQQRDPGDQERQDGHLGHHDPTDEHGGRRADAAAHRPYVDHDQDRPGEQPGHQQLGAECNAGLVGHQHQRGDDQDGNEQHDRLPGPADQSPDLEDLGQVDGDGHEQQPSQGR
jgi:tetratricopeptide (TPR) repeat protein